MCSVKLIRIKKRDRDQSQSLAYFEYEIKDRAFSGRRKATDSKERGYPDVILARGPQI
jgi:hypothetical protein